MSVNLVYSSLPFRLSFFRQPRYPQREFPPFYLYYLAIFIVIQTLVLRVLFFWLWFCLTNRLSCLWRLSRHLRLSLLLTKGPHSSRFFCSLPYHLCSCALVGNPWPLREHIFFLLEICESPEEPLFKILEWELLPDDQSIIQCPWVLSVCTWKFVFKLQ